jgi:hypothetical protein
VTDPDEAPARPLLRVVRGEPTAEELAALVTVISARASGGPEPEPVRASPWASRAEQLRVPITPGPGAWVRSARSR